MNIEELRLHCLSKKQCTESFPFDEHVLVFKVGGKMFALSNLSWEKCAVNLKCDPQRAIELREEYESIRPGYHMSKKYWNTVDCESGLTTPFIKQLIDESYDIVVAGLTKKRRAELKLD